MTIFIIILAVVVLYVVYSKGKHTGESIGIAKCSGGMRKKYAVLLNIILSGHGAAQVFKETDTYILAGVSNIGGTTLFHIEQYPNNQVKITFESKNNPVFRDIKLNFSFPDNMDQMLMMESINKEIEKCLSTMGF